MSLYRHCERKALELEAPSSQTELQLILRAGSRNGGRYHALLY